VYGGLVVAGTMAKQLSNAIDNLRTAAGIAPDFRLKFLPKPENMSHQEFIGVKERLLGLAAEHAVRLLVSVILHDISANADQTRRFEINRICYHFDCFLNRFDTTGIVLIDRFSDAQIDAHLAEKFSIGLTDMPYSRQYRLSNVVGFHYSAIGQSHFTSLIDVVLGSLRFSINAYCREDHERLPTARTLLQFWRHCFTATGAMKLFPN
jgi:hypothetical protein